MDNDSAVQSLIMELGSLLDPAMIDYYEEDSCWVVGVTEDVSIQIVHNHELQALLLVLNLGPAPEANADEVHQMLLKLTYVMAEKGGPVAGLDAEDNAVLMGRAPLDGLTVQQLASDLEYFATQQAAWSRVLLDMGAGDGGATDSARQSQEGVMRV